MEIFMKWLVSVCLWLACSMVAAGEIEFTVHHAAGGPSDRVTRLVAQDLPAGRYMIVNRPGAAGRIAMRQLLARPSVMIATIPQIFVTNPLIFTDLEYDPGRDLELLGVVGVMPNVLVCSPRLGFASFEQVRAHKDSLNFAVGGRGSNEHLATVALLAQWPNSHNIVFYAQGGSASITDLVGGSIDCMFANLPLARPMIQDGRLRPLLTSHDLGLSSDTWFRIFNSTYPMQSELGVIIDRRMDDKIKQQIKKDIQAAFQSVNLDNRIRDIGILPILKTDSKSLAESTRVQNRMREMIVRTGINLKD